MKIEECLHTQIMELLTQNEDISLQRQEVKTKLITLFAVLNKAQELAEELEEIIKDQLIIDTDYFQEIEEEGLTISDYLANLSMLVEQNISDLEYE
jgi:hypothetical protein